MKKESWYVRTFVNPWMPPTVVFLFLGVISFFQINSYWADKHHFNGGWTVIGVILTLCGLFCAYKVMTTSTGKGG